MRKLFCCLLPLLVCIPVVSAKFNFKPTDIAWTYEDGVFEIVLHPKWWPKDCHGATATLFDQAGKAIDVNQSPLFFRATKELDLKNYIVGAPKLLARVEEAQKAWFANESEFLKPPVELGKVHLSSKYIELMLKQPDAFFIHGVRAAVKVPSGEYSLLVKQLNNEGGTIRKLELKELDLTSPPVSPEISNLHLSVLEKEQRIRTTWQFKSTRWFTNQVLRVEVGHLDSQGQFVPGTERQDYDGLERFSVRIKVNTLGLKDEQLAIRVTDYFGRMDVFQEKDVKKEKKSSRFIPKLKIDRLLAGTNGQVVVQWKLVNGQPGDMDHCSVRLERESMMDSELMEDPEYQPLSVPVAMHPGNSLAFIDQLDIYQPTQVLYRATVFDGTEAISSAFSDYRHQGYFRPPRAVIDRVETNLVDGQRIISVIPKQIYGDTAVAHSVLLHYKKRHDPLLQATHNKQRVIPIPPIHYQTEFGISILAETIPERSPDDVRTYLEGAESEIVWVRKPLVIDEPMVNFRKEDTTLFVTYVPTPGLEKIEVVVDGEATVVGATRDFPIDTFSTNGSAIVLHTHHEGGVVVTSRTERVRTYLSGKVILSEVVKTADAHRVNFSLGRHHGQYNNAVLFVDGKVFAEQAPASASSSFSSVPLTDGSTLQLMCVGARDHIVASPVYTHKP